MIYGEARLYNKTSTKLESIFWNVSIVSYPESKKSDVFDQQFQS